MAIKRRASATWQGGFKDGKGTFSTGSGALKDYPHGAATRFEQTPGSNPEELIGAALAGCFTMALALNLEGANLKAEKLEADAAVSLEKGEGGFDITAIHLTLKGKVPGADEKTFKDLAEKTKSGCPVSKLLNARITLDASLVG